MHLLSPTMNLRSWDALLQTSCNQHITFREIARSFTAGFETTLKHKACMPGCRDPWSGWKRSIIQRYSARLQWRPRCLCLANFSTFVEIAAIIACRQLLGQMPCGSTTWGVFMFLLVNPQYIAMVIARFIPKKYNWMGPGMGFQRSMNLSQMIWALGEVSDAFSRDMWAYY